MLTQFGVMGKKQAQVRLLNPFLIPQQLMFSDVCYVKEKLCPKSQKNVERVLDRKKWSPYCLHCLVNLMVVVVAAYVGWDLANRIAFLLSKLCVDLLFPKYRNFVNKPSLCQADVKMNHLCSPILLSKGFE